MMNYIWAGILLVSVVYAMFSGNLDALGTALTESSNEAVEFVIEDFPKLFMSISLRQELFPADSCV